jgi:hypothetical protein
MVRSPDLAPRWARHLPWIDGGSGLLAGALVLAAHAPLARLHHLPPTILLLIGLANVSYGLVALGLARQRVRAPALLTTLIGANLGWTVVCIGLIAGYAGVASPWAIAHQARHVDDEAVLDVALQAAVRRPR